MLWSRVIFNFHFLDPQSVLSPTCCTVSSNSVTVIKLQKSTKSNLQDCLSTCSGIRWTSTRTQLSGFCIVLFGSVEFMGWVWATLSFFWISVLVRLACRRWIHTYPKTDCRLRCCISACVVMHNEDIPCHGRTAGPDCGQLKSRQGLYRVAKCS